MNWHITKIPTADFLKIRLVLMDIDGTLVAGSKFELENVGKQLARLQSHRVKFSFATGRTLFGARRIIQKLDPKGSVPLIIAYNGAVVARPDANPWIERLVIDSKMYRKLITVCRELNVVPLVYTCEDRFTLKEQERVYSEPHMFHHQDLDFNGMPIEKVSDLFEVPKEIVAILAFDPVGSMTDELAKRLRAECGSLLRITTSGGKYVEIAHPSATKRRGIDLLCERLSLQVDQVLAIGDNYNDLEMLEHCGVGVAVRNSPDAVKTASRVICEHESARGVAEILRFLADTFVFEDRRRTVQEGGT